MTLGLISDIHGDPFSLELAWSHLRLLGADRVICAGDVVGYGARPDRAVAFLEDRQIESVRGNHDRWAIEAGAGHPDQFSGVIPSVKTLEYLGSLPQSIRIESDGRVVLVVHGSPTSDMEYILRDTHHADVLDHLLEANDVDVLVGGHTHAPMWYRGARGLVVNPGAVISLPVVRTSRTFALLDVSALTVTIHDVESGRVLDVPVWK